MLARIQTLIFFILVSSILKFSSAFCFYNTVQGDDGETSFWIDQLAQNAGDDEFKRFVARDMKQGEKSCCHYSNRDCVKSARKEEEVRFAVLRKTNGRMMSTFQVTVWGGGWVELGGGHELDSATINVYKPNGEPYDYTYAPGYTSVPEDYTG